MHNLETCLVLVLVVISNLCDALNCEGCVPLDGLSFDKVVSKFPASLVKFDVAYPYGDKHDEFSKVSKDGASLPDLLIGEVGIKDYGEQENSELGKRFNVQKADYPVLILFVKNNKQGSIDQHRFSADLDFTALNIKEFIKQKSGMRIPLQGCVEQLDIIAESFASLSEEDKRQNIKSAEDIAKELSDDQAKSANMYIKVMKRLSSDGLGFLSSEENRINKLLTTKLQPAKKEEMEIRLNILQSFKPAHFQSTKEEL